MRRIRRFPKKTVLIAALVTAFGAVPDTARSAPQAQGCTNLDAIPIAFTIDYQAAIQGIFDNHCVGCHEGNNPPAGLSLTAGGSWSHLIHVPSSEEATLARVVPDQPLASWLFLKINCQTPGFGLRMPRDADPLSEDEQALILDWISEGAPSSTTDTIFRGEFEIRG